MWCDVTVVSSVTFCCRWCEGASDGLVVDLANGTGYYLAEILGGLPDRDVGSWQPTARLSSRHRVPLTCGNCSGRSA